MKTTIASVAAIAIAIALFAQNQTAHKQAVVTPPAPRLPEVPENPDQNFTSLAAAHGSYVRDFASRPGFGSSRMVFLPSQDCVKLDGIVYRFKTPDLIGLENDPVVYQRAGGIENLSVAVMSKKKLRSRLARRPLTTIESNAVVKLRAGNNLVIQRGQVEAQMINSQKIGRTDGIHAIASLRATASCAHCHGVKEGTLLGAFSYSLVPTNAQVIAIQPPKPLAGNKRAAPTVLPPPVHTNLSLTLSTRFAGGLRN